jgi:hypothetical protein
MKFYTSVAIASIVFIIIIVSTTCGCTSFVPYNSVGAFSKEYAYEGFTTTHESGEYGSTKTNIPIDSHKSFLINPDADKCKKIYGFDGLYCKPYEADNKIDPFSDTHGSLECIGSSSGLTNSAGGLCLSESQKQMLMTRGGNQTGAPMQIGH